MKTSKNIKLVSMITTSLAVAFIGIASLTLKNKTYIETSAWSGKQVSNAPSSYYSATEGLSGNALLSSLRSFNQPGNKSYDWSRYEAADEAEGDSSSIICIYTRHNIKKSAHVGSYSWDTWNREHIWTQTAYPNSKTDNHNIFACEGQINNTRNNKAYKEFNHNVTSPVTEFGHTTDCYTDANWFEPPDEGKGEVARAVLYGVVYYNYTMTNMVDKPETLVKWHLEHPVSNRDIFRNNTVYGLQGNRNPFVDKPDLVCRVWGDTNEQTKALCANAPVIPDDPDPVDTISLDRTSATLNVGQTLKLVATASGNVSWKSNNNAVATVSSSGLVTAVATGSATITATCGSAQATCVVTISKTQSGEDSVSFNDHNIELEVGDTMNLGYTSSNSNVTFTSSDNNIVSVTNSGAITALKAGTATITIQCGEAIDHCVVTVVDSQGESGDLPHRRGCGGNIITTSGIVAFLSLAGIACLLIRKKHE